MNSNRIAPFRTYTIPSAYSLFMSPNPTYALDGNGEGSLRSNPGNRRDIVPYPEDLLEDMVGNLSFLSIKMSKLLNVKRQREDLMKMIEFLKAKAKEK